MTSSTTTNPTTDPITNPTSDPVTTTAEVIDRFNDAFLPHDSSRLVGLIAPDCVMETIEPAPNGTRREGRAACLASWQELAENRSGWFDLEDVVVGCDWTIIRWRYHYGDGEENSVRGVNLVRVRDGQIVEAQGYGKHGEAA